jgi:hypothetical protein
VKRPQAHNCDKRPNRRKEHLQLDINVPGVVFGEPIETTDTVSDFEITLDRLGEIYRLVRYDVSSKICGLFPAGDRIKSCRKPKGRASGQGGPRRETLVAATKWLGSRVHRQAVVSLAG